MQRLAAALTAKGLKRGDRIAIRLGNSSHSALMFFAAIAAGFVALPLSDQLTTTELGTLLEDSGAAAIATARAFPKEIVPESMIVLTAADVAAMLKHPARLDYAPTMPDDPAFLVYTSGTTARSKGVLHAHRSAFGRRPMYQGWYGIGPTTACCTPALSTGRSRSASA